MANRTDAEMAAALINTKHVPSGLLRMKELADKAKAYHNLTPYPLYAFRNWKTEDRGPLPICMAIAKDVVKRGAKWLFGKPLQLTVPGNADFEALIRDAWTENKMDSRLVAMAEKAGQEAGVVLKFAYDSAEEDCPLTFQSLSPIEECRLYFHPHNRQKLLMARIQYPYTDASDGLTYFYREEWTAQEEVRYAPVLLSDLPRKSNEVDPEGYEDWEIVYREANPFGVIPCAYIRNIETDDVWGGADLWSLAEGDGLFGILDRINLTRFLQDKSNQFDSEINAWIIDAELPEDDIDRPQQPGEPKLLEFTDSDGGKQGKVVFPPGGNGLRPAMAEYIKDLSKEMRAAASSVYVDQAEFTNKGNLTRAVLEQLYLPQIEITLEKRKSWGNDGICQFLALVAKGLVALKVLKAKPSVEAADAANKKAKNPFAVQIGWADFFPMSEDEKAAAVGRTQEEEIAGYLPHGRAVERVAHMEGIEDVEQLKKEIAAQPKPSLTETDPNAPGGSGGAVTDAEKEIAGLKGAGGKSAL